MKLTDKQKRFAEEYSVDFNGTQAAIRAGYSKKTAASQAERLLRNVEVQKYLSEIKGKLADRTEITKDQLVAELSKIAFFDIRKIYTVDGGLKNIHDFGDDEAAAVAGIESYDTVEPDSGMVLGTTKKVKVSPKIAAIERLCKMLGYEAPTKQDVNLSQPIINFVSASSLTPEQLKQFQEGNAGGNNDSV